MAAGICQPAAGRKRSGPRPKAYERLGRRLLHRCVRYEYNRAALLIPSHESVADAIQSMRTGGTRSPQQHRAREQFTTGTRRSLSCPLP